MANLSEGALARAKMVLVKDKERLTKYRALRSKALRLLGEAQSDLKE